MSDAKKECSMEERLEHLENIIGQMEEDQVSLEDSFALYKQGLEEIKEANAMLDQMEKTMVTLTEEMTAEES